MSPKLGEHLKINLGKFFDTFDEMNLAERQKYGGIGAQSQAAGWHRHRPPRRGAPTEPRALRHAGLK